MAQQQCRLDTCAGGLIEVVEPIGTACGWPTFAIKYKRAKKRKNQRPNNDDSNDSRPCCREGRTKRYERCRARVGDTKIHRQYIIRCVTVERPESITWDAQAHSTFCENRCGRRRPCRWYLSVSVYCGKDSRGYENRRFCKFVCPLTEIADWPLNSTSLEAGYSHARYRSAWPLTQLTSIEEAAWGEGRGRISYLVYVENHD